MGKKKKESNAVHQTAETPPVGWVHVGGVPEARGSFLSQPRASVAATDGATYGGETRPGSSWGSRKWWDALPGINQGLLALWGAAITLAVIGTGGPRVADVAGQAMFPYTAEGKRQTCADNLRAIYQAAALYAQDYDERFPALETKMVSAPDSKAPTQKAIARRTWVSALSQHVQPAQFQCPTDGTYRDITQTPVASYVMNPVLAERKAADVDDPTMAVFLAEGGEKHDVSLLPPLPTWTGTDKDAFGANPSLSKSSFSNFSFRHLDAANVIYADGHAGSIEKRMMTDAPPSSVFWGGSAAMRLALDRITARDALSTELVTRLLKGDSHGATSILRAHSQPLQPCVRDLAVLCLSNGGSLDADAWDGEWKYSSDKIERLGWTLARTNAAMGSGELLKKLNHRLGLRNAAELRTASELGSAGSNPAWQIIPIASGYRIEVPPAWTSEKKQEGRYQRATFRSEYGDVSLLCEIGERKTPIEPRPVDWAGTEAALKRSYGADYKRIKMGRNESLLGMEASVWEYEIEKPGGPRLHKLCIGRAAGWNSFVLACSAPATHFDKWGGVFKRATASFGEM